MLVIHPDECIDCGVCEPECPADAIQAEDESNLKWLELGREYAPQWPNIKIKGTHAPDADSFKGEEGKFEKYFSPNPGTEHKG